MTTPEVRKSELNAVRRFLATVRDEQRLAMSPRGGRFESSPLKARVAHARGSSRAPERN
jgi:hypothetical protein